MKDNSRLLLEKAERAIRAAQTLLVAGNFPDFATGRAYYAMFYVAEALLEEKELRFSKHGGVHGAFGEHYVKSGLFEAKYHRWLWTPLTNGWKGIMVLKSSRLQEMPRS